MRLVSKALLLRQVNLNVYLQVPSGVLPTSIRPLGILYGHNHLRFSDHDHILQIPTQIPFLCNYILVGPLYSSPILILTAKCQDLKRYKNVILSSIKYTFVWRVTAQDDIRWHGLFYNANWYSKDLFTLSSGSLHVSLVSNVINIVLYRTNENTQVQSSS